MIKKPIRKKTTGAPHRVGAHLSIAGGHHKAIELATELACEIVQVFTKNNMQWLAPPLTGEAITSFRRARESAEVDQTFAHAGYLINLAATNPQNLEKSRQSLLLELERCSLLDLPFIVLHPGAHLGAGEEAGLHLIAASLKWIFERYTGETKIALEVTAGQGSCLGARVEHLAHLVQQSTQPERLAVCLDTCHLFAAGYDIRTASGVDQFLVEFQRHLPWDKVVCAHLNDSKGELGSRLDRHELLGKGKIGWECFETILNHSAFAELPLCLETPKGKDNANDREMLSRLKAARAKRPRPR